MSHEDIEVNVKQCMQELNYLQKERVKEKEGNLYVYKPEIGGIFVRCNNYREFKNNR